jgi:hypothetical protein
MALFHECMWQCAQKELDTADIVRDAILGQQSLWAARPVVRLPSLVQPMHKVAIAATDAIGEKST